MTNYKIENAEKALELLKEGNKRFVDMELTHPNLSKERRLEIEQNGQSPYAIFISCADSRVPLVHVFDAGLGDLFEIKNAGNLTDDHVLGSAEFAVAHMGVKLVIVLGHSNCGCIKTAITSPEGLSRHVSSLIESVVPAVKYTIENDEEVSLYNVTKNNAILGAKTVVRENETIRNFVKEHGVVVMPAYYNGESGAVEFFSEHQTSAENV
ncbi:carbonic anhydrase [Candidatus Gastranaerophilus sp. (ex Termes propinquus)]|nr:carbonic anhydrase [Candidatus Gastranaerophilus sp. (ex Termes propinquus)]